MSKKIYYVFGILAILSLSLMLQTFTTVVGLNLSVVDPENDVYYMHYKYTTPENMEIKKGDYHDEIDIIKLDVTGQHFNLTFAADITSWNLTHQALIMLISDFNFQQPPFPYYAISYENPNDYGLYEFHVFFLYVTGSYEEDREYWNNVTGWVSTPDLASDIGFSTDRSIIADAPTEAYLIPDDIDCVATASCLYAFFAIEDVYQYLDIAPNKYDPYGGGVEKFQAMTY